MNLNTNLNFTNEVRILERNKFKILVFKLMPDVNHRRRSSVNHCEPKLAWMMGHLSCLSVGQETLPTCAMFTGILANT